jgi:hypothetical protein
LSYRWGARFASAPAAPAGPACSSSFFSVRRDPTPHESDIHVGTPKRGNTQRITMKYAAINTNTQ